MRCLPDQWCASAVNSVAGDNFPVGRESISAQTDYTPVTCLCGLLISGSEILPIHCNHDLASGLN